MKEKNKYQEALDNAISDIEYCYNDSFEEVPEKRLKEVELLQQLVDKETPKEPITEILQYKCPTCKIYKVGKITDNGWETKGEGFTNYCPICGQKLKW